MSAALVPSHNLPAVERALVQGDLSALNDEQRMDYYRSVCESLDLNPLTKPFDYIKLNGKLQLYAKKDCAEQLRRNHNISLVIVHREERDGIYEVTAQAKTPDGRVDEDTGCVPISGLKGDALANARMKATTKAKRRVTLSICGLGFLDETEVESIPGARTASAPVVLPPANPEPQEPTRPVNGNGHASGNRHTPQTKAISGKEFADKCNELSSQWEQAGLCSPAAFFGQLNEWAKAKGYTKPAEQWSADWIKAAGDFLRELKKKLEEPAPASILASIDNLFANTLRWPIDKQNAYLREKYGLHPGELPNEHTAQHIILALQEEARPQPEPVGKEEKMAEIAF